MQQVKFKYANDLYRVEIDKVMKYTFFFILKNVFELQLTRTLTHILHSHDYFPFISYTYHSLNNDGTFYKLSGT